MWNELDKVKDIVYELTELYRKGNINKERFLKLYRDNVLRIAKAYSKIKADRHHMIMFLFSQFPLLTKSKIDLYLMEQSTTSIICIEVIETARKWNILMGKESTEAILNTYYNKEQVKLILQEAKIC